MKIMQNFGKFIQGGIKNIKNQRISKEKKFFN